MKNKRMLLPLLIILSSVLVACSAALPQADRVAPAFEPGVAVDVVEEVEMLAEAPVAADADARFMSGEVPQERLVIRNANLAVVVPDPAASVEAIGRMAQEMDGFVVASNVFQSTFGPNNLVADQASITIRVPSERLDEALERIKRDATEVRNESVSGQDVTEEFTDLQSRLTNLEAAEEQLREIMASAVKTEDVLRVFEDLRRVREEIEVIRGRIQFLEQSARLSSISVELIPDVAAQPIQIAGWSPQGTAKSAVEALVRTLQVLGNAIIWVIIYVVPVAIILLALPALLAAWAIRRRRRGTQAATPKGD